MKEVAAFGFIFVLACAVSILLGLGLGKVLFSTGRLLGVYP